jgi:hypothetical protein
VRDPAQRPHGRAATVDSAADEPARLREDNHSLKTELAIAYGHQRDIRRG